MPTIGSRFNKGWAKIHPAPEFHWHFFRDGSAICDPMVVQTASILMPIPLGKHLCPVCNQMAHPAFTARHENRRKDGDKRL